ncbi:Histone acetyltransferase type B catalytic subunit [Intoshia linei]|uniref:histone acetyltransferase n=1 Tax=Intoshia linei TaxID=1819745 RepID=A0A177B732_9BILA|nr:Histone acetyltransferase type B catalytic subunit [Intoshia linei]
MARRRSFFGSKPARRSSPSRNGLTTRKESSLTQAPRQPGLMANMASTAAGVAIGSTVGHAIGGALTGGMSQSENVDYAEANPRDYRQPVSNEMNGGACSYELQQFIKCTNMNNDISFCQQFSDALKTCKRTDANESVTFIPVSSDGSDLRETFHPDMTHQIFGCNESIYGYESPAINILYSVETLDFYVKFNYSHKVDETDTKPDDVISILNKELYLNQSYNYSIEDFRSNMASHQKFIPPGKLVNTYSLNDATFSVYYGSTESNDISKYHYQAQRFILFFVDAASYINVNDTSWNVFYLFETTQDVHKFIGFITTYSFYKYPGTRRLRVSQAMILPPYQRRGHGSRLLKSIYQWAHQNSRIQDVSVEDASDQFQRIRDFVEYDIIKCSDEFKNDTLPYYSPFQGAVADKISKKFCILRRRIERLRRLHIVRMISTDEKKFKKFKQSIRYLIRKNIKRTAQQESDGIQDLINTKGGKYSSTSGIFKYYFKTDDKENFIMFIKNRYRRGKVFRKELFDFQMTRCLDNFGVKSLDTKINIHQEKPAKRVKTSLVNGNATTSSMNENYQKKVSMKEKVGLLQQNELDSYDAILERINRDC